jgi:hypothetical protein
VVARLIAAATRVDARPCALVPADQAFAEATLIVKGSLISTAAGTEPGADSTSVIRIQRVVKGATKQRQIAVTHFLCGLEYSLAMNAGRPLIVFVNSTGGLVGGTAVLPTSSRAATDASADARSDLRSELLLAATDDDPRITRAAVGALAELDGPAATPVLNEAANASDLGTRVRALTWLTRFGDATAFDRLAEMLAQPAFAQSTSRVAIRNDHDASLVIAHEDVFRALSAVALRDPFTPATPAAQRSQFAQTMASLARSQPLGIRREAIQALRQLKEPASFPVLADALDDPDADIRYNAMSTLCTAMQAPDLPCPSIPLFEENEQRYVARVREWWNRQRFD